MGPATHSCHATALAGIGTPTLRSGDTLALRITLGSGHTISLSPKPGARRLVPRVVVQQHPCGPRNRFLPLSGDPPRQPAVSRHPRLFGGPGRISLLL